MTDTFGSEPHDQESGHDEVLTPEHEPIHEAPSEDEFADHHGDDLGAAVTEEHGEDHGDDSGASSMGEPGRRSPLLPIIAAIGGVVLLGSVAWWQFSGSSSSLPPANETATMAPMPMTPPAPSSVTGNDVPASTVAPKTMAAPVATSPAPAIPAQISTNAPAAGVVTSNGYAPIVQQPAASSAAEDQRIAALTARIDNLQKALDQATQQLGQVTNMVAATTTTATTSPASSNNKELEDKIDRLEQQIAAMNRAAPVTVATESAPKPVMTAPVYHRPAPHKVVHKIVKKPSVEVEKDALPPAPTPPAQTWVLRAAMPGQAWVATSATSHDLKAVHVGDTLPGVGRVTAIQDQNGSWSVKGTTGSIQ